MFNRPPAHGNPDSAAGRDHQRQRPHKERAIARGYVGSGLRPAPPHPLAILILIVATLAS